MTTVLMPQIRPAYIRRSQTPPADVFAACVDQGELFQHPLLEDGAKPSGVEQRNLQQMLLSKTENICLDCPLMIDCLYRAVVECNVDGVCAGTTVAQRMAMRDELGIQVEDEDLNSLAGPSGSQIVHDEVLRLRSAYPDESLESIANRLGCSLSTVKRHLRRARNEAAARRTEKPQVRPTVEDVIVAYNKVVLGRQAERRAA